MTGSWVSPATKKITLFDQTGKWAQLWLRERTRKSVETKQREREREREERGAGDVRVPTTARLPNHSETVEMARAAAVCSAGLSGVRPGRLPGQVLPSRVPGLATAATGAAETGNLFARVETRPPRARPGPAGSPRCDPPGDKRGPPGLEPGSGSRSPPRDPDGGPRG